MQCGQPPTQWVCRLSLGWKNINYICLEIKVLRKIFLPKKNETNEHHIIRNFVIYTDHLFLLGYWLARHVVKLGETRIAYRTLIRKRLGKAYLEDRKTDGLH
jgi:hypothetical protein